MSANTAIGSPIWLDYVCQDADAARAFYTNIFGWSYLDQGAEFGHYNIISAGTDTVGGLMRAMTPDGQPDPAIPTAWTIYLLTDDIHRATDKVVEHGGTVALAPMQVGDMGWMAVAVDPAGAHFGLWQHIDFAGMTVDGAPGTGVWFENMSTAYDQTKPFYREVFGWQNAPMSDDGQSLQDDHPDPNPTPGENPDGSSFEGEGAVDTGYVTNFAGTQASAGLCDAKQWFDQSQWRVYFSVASVDDAAAIVEKLGGKVLDGPMDTPFGRIATVTDLEGATFQLHEKLSQ